MKKRLIFYGLFVLFFTLQTNIFAQSEHAAPLIKKAKDHLNLFQYDQARALLKQALQVDPENWEAYFLVGKSFLKQKNEVEAEKYLSKAHGLNSQDLDCQKALGSVYISMAKQAKAAGKNSEMTEFLHKACKAYPAATKIWQSLFESWWLEREYDKIINEGEFVAKENKRALEQGDDKSLQQVMVIVAKCHYQKGDFPNTEKFLKYASMIRQTNEELYSLKREIKAKADANARNLIETAKAEADKGNYDKALELLAQAEKTSSASEIQEMIDKIQHAAGVDKVLNQANQLRQANKHEEALSVLEEASMQFPEDEKIANLYAVVSKTVEKIHNEQAEKNAQIIFEKRKKLEQAKKYRYCITEGQKNEKAQNFELALINYQQALEINPQNEELKKKIEEIKVDSEKFKERQERYAEARADFLSAFDTKAYDDAFAKGSQIEEDFPERKKEIVPALAEICLRLGKFEEAKNYCLEFESDDDQKNLYNYIMGMVAYNQGDKEQALGHLKNLTSESFRDDVSSTIWAIYLYKYQIGLYIVGLILLFPIIKGIKSVLAGMRQSSILRRIEKIRETGAYEANISFLEERFAKEDTPNNKQIAVMLAEGLLRKGNAQRCYEIISNLLKRDAKNPQARRLAGEACLALEDSSPMGLEHIQNLFKIDESRKDVIEYLARTYIRQQADHKLAQDFILKYIAQNPGDTEALAFLADSFMKRQTYNQQSLKIYERMVKSAPDVPDYYSALITNFRKLDNHEEARKITEIARARFPEAPEFMEGSAPTVASRIGLAPAASGGFPDYDNIGTPAATGGFPDYDSIGVSDNALPDYENIGNEPTQPVNIAQESSNPSGPTKVCPNCSAANSIKEYYCTSCGRPL
jgi:tetratricopeptide (TPR) repeat protein